MKTAQQSLMNFDPVDGGPRPYPSHAGQWRTCYPSHAWLFNPWSGERRSAEDVGTDTFGVLILPPGEVLAPAKAITQVRPNTAKDWDRW
jgi:hypothetical protein